MFSTDDTIVAVATPPGRGGVAMARISGPAAYELALRLAGRSRPLTARRATRVRLRGVTVADDALITYFPAPASYTGQDVVEISTHGSPVVMAAILAAAVDLGARAARPGEFTLRAFLNGKIDLVQAEAVGDLVEAVSPAQARIAAGHLEGGLSRAIGEVVTDLDALRLRLEASMDFPDEGYHFIDRPEAAMALRRLLATIERLCDGESVARRLRDGHLVVVAGAPNVGKSSLFNALLGGDRAIVTPIAGTTRDLVSEHVLVAGAHVRLVDTAGVRVAADAIEAEGIRRAEAVMAEADLVVVVLDRSRHRNADDRRVLEMTEARRRVVIANKGDRPSASGAEQGADLIVSAATAAGIDALATLVGARLTEVATPPNVLVTSARQRALLDDARASLAHAAAALDVQGDDLPEEFLAADVERAQIALEELVGRRAPDDLLAEIFSRFCIGK